MRRRRVTGPWAAALLLLAGCGGSRAPAATAGVDVAQVADAGDDAPAGGAPDGAHRGDAGDGGARPADTGAPHDAAADAGDGVAQPDGGTDGTGADTQPCGVWGAPVKHGKAPPPIDEASGLVVSAVDPGVLWTHNDGSDARLYAVQATTGKLLATLTFPGLLPPSQGDKADWEDLAAGPCGAGATSQRCLYIGDIGDNGEARETVRVFRIAEPDPAAGSAAVTQVETLVLSYPGSKRNSEALVVDASGVVWLLSKSKTTLRLYRAPFPPTPPAAGKPATATLELVAKVKPEAVMKDDAGRITAADWDVARQRLLLRTNADIWEVCLGPDATGAPGPGLPGLVDAPWHKITPADEPQGEAVAYSDAGIWHLSEGAWQRMFLLPRPK